jgi:hypothetical protein
LFMRRHCAVVKRFLHEQSPDRFKVVMFQGL